MNEPITQVTVVCDSPRHPGKLAKVVVFGATGAGEWVPHGIVKKRRIGRRADIADSVYGLEGDQRTNYILAHPRQCKLCGRKFSLRVKRWALFAALNELAARGESEVPIGELSLLASTEHEKG